MRYTCRIKLPFDRATTVEKLIAAGIDVAELEWTFKDEEVAAFNIEADSPEGAKQRVGDALGVASDTLDFTWEPT